MKPVADKYLSKFLSRKLLVWLTTTGLLIGGLVTGEQWISVAIAYVGFQGFADLAVRWKSGKTRDE